MSATKGRLLDVLVSNGGVQVFECRRDRRQRRALWIFVAACLLASVAAAILGA